ncbi:MAG: nodulation protein NfeD [Negativicutes bacterium]
MVGRRFIILLLATIVLSGMFLAPVSAAEAPVIVIQIKGEIDAGQASVVRRAMAEAAEKRTQAILVEVDTFGGLVDFAVKIRDMISDAPIPTICYVRNRAWSAGALIALSHRYIAMAPGASIGAAEPIPATEKTIAAIKAEFAATAGKTGRNPRVAEAMVDKSLGLPGYAEPGQILALTEVQAIKVGYADLIAADREAVLAHYGYSGVPIVEYKMEWADRLIGWLSDPAVKSILLTIIFLAVLTEVKTAGSGIAGLIGLGAAVLFFAGQWMAGLAGIVEILLFVSGLVLIVVEFYTPGLGLFGFAGLGCIFASLFFTLGGDLRALNILAVSMAGAVAVFLLILKKLPSSKLWSQMVLKDSERTQDGFVSAHDYSRYIGQQGKTLTLLRPAGIAEIAGEHLDVVSDGQYVKMGTTVIVISVSGNRIVVRPVPDEEK